MQGVPKTMRCDQYGIPGSGGMGQQWEFGKIRHRGDRARPVGSGGDSEVSRLLPQPRRCSVVQLPPAACASDEIQTQVSCPRFRDSL